MLSHYTAFNVLIFAVNTEQLEKKTISLQRVKRKAVLKLGGPDI
jgi:hypothetical protein